MALLLPVFFFVFISPLADASPAVSVAPKVNGSQVQGVESSDCPSCSVAQVGRNSSWSGADDMVEAVKGHILNMLHLSARPNLTHLVPRAALLNALQKLQVGRVTADGSVKIQEEESRSSMSPEAPSEIITFGEPGVSHNVVTFDFSKEASGSLAVEEANIWIFLKVLRGSHVKGRVMLRLLTADGEEDCVSEKMVDARRSGWHALTVSRCLQTLLDGVGSSLSLSVSCPMCTEAGAAPVLVDRSHQPFLMTALRGEETVQRRVRRGLDCDGKIQVCCKRQFYVNFRDIGWSDWIIAPAGYHANYCEGDCPNPMASMSGSAPSFHAAVINHYRIRGFGPVQNLRSCCVPTRLRAVSMLYYNEEQKIIKKDIQNMMVDECGCS